MGAYGRVSHALRHALPAKNKIMCLLYNFTATLLDGGRTAHSALKLLLNIQTNENATCYIKKHSGMAKILQKCNTLLSGMNVQWPIIIY